jgi:hypothetical protein
MNAYHSQGNITYAVSGPGGTVSPWDYWWLGPLRVIRFTNRPGLDISNKA